MTADLSLVTVAHRSSGCLGAAVESFRRAADAADRRLEVVVVEQSEDPAEVEAAQRLTPDRLLVRRNQGYAAGLNAGIAEASGETLLLANPDVEPEPESLVPLLEALASGFAVVGPQLQLGDFLFPPAEAQTPRAEARRWLATLGRRARRRYLHRELTAAARVWHGQEPQPVTDLSGALLACRRQTAEAIGSWDEGYFLYFEETDWLRRARRDGGRLAVVPDSRARHAWGHAADPAAQAGRFEVSRRRYYERAFGGLGRLAVRLPRRRPPWMVSSEPRLAPDLDGYERLVTADPLGYPAGLHRGTRDLASALAEFRSLSPASLRFFSLAWDPGRGEIRGPWPVDPKRGSGRDQPNPAPDRG